ncbi:hypothetical protein F443_00023, partial [Phytophthora nicotianae P1569]
IHSTQKLKALSPKENLKIYYQPEVRAEATRLLHPDGPPTRTA